MAGRLNIRGPEASVAQRRLVPFQQRLVHLAGHAGLLVLAWVGIAVVTVTIVVVVPGLPLNFVWFAAFGFALWHSVITSSIAVLVSRFRIAPWLILGLHAFSPPITFAIYAVLQAPVWRRYL